MCHKITATETTFEHTFFEPYFKKFSWQFKTETSAAVLYNSNTRYVLNNFIRKRLRFAKLTLPLA